MKPHLKLTVGVLLVGVVAIGSHCPSVIFDPADPLFHLDVMDPATARAAEVVPGTPWLDPGPDGTTGTSDDVRRWYAIGDVDLVVRTGTQSMGATIPAGADPAAPPAALAEPFAQGTPVAYAVAAVAASDSSVPVTTPSLDGVLLLALAFADLDADGFIGVTLLDGDPFDSAIEEAELTPVARRATVALAGRASGEIYVPAAGPAGAPLRVIIAAAATAGVLDPAYLGGVIPDGPVVMTALPALPRTDPNRLFDFGPQGPSPAGANTLLALEIEPAFEPNPLIDGEAYTIAVDGSEFSVDLATVSAGGFARIGLGQRPDPLQYRSLPQRPIRPGIDDAGRAVPYEILQRLFVPDDGAASTTVVRLLPLDRLGNITEPGGVKALQLVTGGTVRIVSPDADGDPYSEFIAVGDVEGVEVVLDDDGAVYDSANQDTLEIRGLQGGMRIDLLLPDPDVSDNGSVGPEDVAIVRNLKGSRLGDSDFEASADLDGDGRIDGNDEAIVSAALGEVISVP